MANVDRPVWLIKKQILNKQVQNASIEANKCFKLANVMDTLKIIMLKREDGKNIEWKHILDEQKAEYIDHGIRLISQKKELMEQMEELGPKSVHSGTGLSLMIMN